MNETIKTKAQELYPIESHANEHTAFLQGAKCADKTMLEKVCEWLKENIDKDLVIYNNQSWTKRDVFIDKLKKAMAE